MLQKFKYNKNFILESGEVLHGIEIAYTVYGKMNKFKNNVIWFCHALTGNSEVKSWWGGLVGKGKFFNPDNYFIICANILGSCYGSTGPLSINPKTKKPYYHTFPRISIRDIANSLVLLKKYLQIEKIHILIGGSLGGMQALEWSIIEPKLCNHLILMATSAQSSPWFIALNESQRMAIEADQSWNESHNSAGINGMKVARSIALLSYRTYHIYKFSQSEENSSKIDYYRSSSYQRYQGEKLATRFNAFSYWILTKLLDSHHIGRNRGNIESTLNTISIPTTVIGISSDLLFPPEEQKFIAQNIPNAMYFEINSLYGHDGFLLEFEKIASILKSSIKI